MLCQWHLLRNRAELTRSVRSDCAVRRRAAMVIGLMSKIDGVGGEGSTSRIWETGVPGDRTVVDKTAGHSLANSSRRKACEDAK